MVNIEKTLDYLWFQVIAKKAHYRCEICSIPTEHPAHHIYSRGLSVRWDINNGILLCLNCHTKAHKNTKQFRKDYGTSEMDKKFRQPVKYLDYGGILENLKNYL